MLQAQEIQFRLRLPPLLRGEVVLPEVKLTKPDLALAIDEKGVANWSFSKNPTAAAASEVAAPEERTEAPVIGELVVQDADREHGVAPSQQPARHDARRKRQRTGPKRRLQGEGEIAGDAGAERDGQPHRPEAALLQEQALDPPAQARPPSRHTR